ncbi:MAG TPA: hypothetical protein ENH44_03340, partial [Actinobacteria bacterium]|nr:hypothetical protein [Actinomycetota bacterium]
MSGRTIGLYLTPGYDARLVVRLEKGLRRRGAKAVLVGSDDREPMGIPTISLADTAVEDMDALVIPAYSTSEPPAGDEKILTLLIVMQNSRKPVGAIGNAPIV